MAQISLEALGAEIGKHPKVNGKMKDARSSQQFPVWAPKAGVVFAAVTLVFFMLLVILSVFGNTIPEDASFPIASVLALGLAFASAFMGGDAAAKGQLPSPFLNKYPVQFSVAGGIAVFVIVFLFGIELYPSTGGVKAKHPLPLDLTGEWFLSDDSASYYGAKLTQNGKLVSGTYTRDNQTGTVEGSVKGNELELIWDQPYNSRGGTAILDIYNNGKTLSGHWSYDPKKYRSGMNGGGTWTFQKRSQE
jgi:hypothetical protein